MFGFLLGSVLAGSGLYYYVVDEYKVSNELLTEDVYVSWHDDRIKQHTRAYTRRSGTPICSPEARGLRQGPRAGGQVEEVGAQQNLHDTTLSDKETRRTRQKHRRWKKRGVLHLSVHVYTQLAQTNPNIREST